ncbi:MAG TPA: sensor histidine kinase [Streptosporangiaceae bacterium]|nr:sensor histidine kinase [Streptosporangiaceae bacterium]
MTRPDSGFEVIDHRFELLIRLLPYPLAVLPLLPYALSQSPSSGAFAITCAMVAGTMAWVALLTTGRPPWELPRWRGAVYMAGMVGCIFLLATRSPWFAFFSWIGFLHGFGYLYGMWRWVAVAPVAFAFAVEQGGGFHRPDLGTWVIWCALTVVDIAMIGGLGTMSMRTQEQNQARKRMIAELADANERLEKTIAENTGLQAQLLVQAREAGILEERQRLAREIHDTLAQGLTGIIAQLEAAQLALARRTGHASEQERRIGNATRLARDSLAEARRSVQALRPAALDGARLPDALTSEAARWSVTSGVAAEVTTTGEPRPLHPEVEVTLLRVAQEALANTAKHARAAHAWVTLSYMGDVVTLDVRDDGIGFTSSPGAPLSNAPRPAGGFGLTAMRQRVQRLAGQLEIESEPGAGTAVSATVPAIPVAAEQLGGAA